MERLKHKIRDASSALLYAVGELLPPGQPTNPADCSVRLTNALSDILQIQERISLMYEEQRKVDLAWRRESEARFLQLESELQVIKARNSQQPRCNSPVAKRVRPITESCFHDDQVVQTKRAKVAREDDESEARCSDVGVDVIEERREDSSEIQKVGKRYRPSLPTVQDVQMERGAAAKKRRAKENGEKVPCDKCRCRKRADMLRASGYIDEEKFEEWAARPGGCFLFMHQDDSLPHNSNHSLSFSSSQTRSPANNL